MKTKKQLRFPAYICRFKNVNREIEQIFYGGQWLNYLLFVFMTVSGFVIAKRLTVVNVFAASLAAPSAFFLLSNFTVWASGGGYHYPFYRS